MSTIAIIGGGFAGTLTAVNLIYQADGPLHIVHIEAAQKRCRGIAYSTECPLHLLNVQAGRMSAFPDQPLHFLKWARSKDSKVSESSFLSRNLYGQYLDFVLESALSSMPNSVSYDAIGDEAISIKLIQDETKAVIKLAGGNVVVADRVVLATGNFNCTTPHGVSESIAASERYRGNPWHQSSRDYGTAYGDILLIGTGLTAIDKIVEITQSGFRGNLYAVSRHGLLPAAHTKSSLPAFAQTELRPELFGDLNLLFNAVKNAIRNVSYRELFDNASTVNMEVADWRQIIDALRPHSQGLWSALSDTQKKRFLRHVRTYWDVSRHRMAPEIGSEISKLTESGRLRTIAGRIYSLQETDEALIATIMPRSGELSKQIKVIEVINCCGLSPDFSRAKSPLAQSLIARGLVKPHPTGLGLSMCDDGKLWNQEGKLSKVLYSLGAPAIGVRGESIAVPELRVQAKDLAWTLLNSARIEPDRPLPLFEKELV